RGQMVHGKEGFVMCGRYTVYTEQEVTEMREIINEINKKFGYDLKTKTSEIFPTDEAPVLVLSDGGGEAEPRPMAWGFPGWNGRGVIINAKAETVFEKKLFCSSVLSRRCVIPSTGFFEWRHAENKKQKDKFLIRFANAPVLYMAGFYNIFSRPDGSSFHGFVILTTEASGSVAQIHSRMPVVLHPEEKLPWLKDDSCAKRILKRRGPDLFLSLVS
ncbi:MAG: SOS response-associated peptidase, partial [Bacillota bacterium]|nr:SOS response-associated peptidase [Bacillota bacterium]